MYFLAVGNTRLTENGITPEPNLRLDFLIAVYLTSLKAYIHGSLFGTTARSIRCILQRDKRIRNERHKVHSAASIGQLEKLTDSPALDVV